MLPESPNFSLAGKPGFCGGPRTWGRDGLGTPSPDPSNCPPALASLVRDPSLCTGVSCLPDLPPKGLGSPTLPGSRKATDKTKSGTALAALLRPSRPVPRTVAAALGLQAHCPPAHQHLDPPSLLDPAEPKDEVEAQRPDP